MAGPKGKAGAAAARKRYPGGKASERAEWPALIERAVTRAEEGADEAARYRIVIATDREIERWGFGMRWREKLDHSPGAVQVGRLTSGHMAFLRDHDRTIQLGVIVNGVVADGVVAGEVRWGVNAQAQERKAEIDAGTGVGVLVSVGYIAKRWQLVEEDEERGDLWVCTLWEPIEASSVSIPADVEAGFVGRDGEPGGFPVETEEARTMLKKWILADNGRAVQVDETDERQALTDTQVAGLQLASRADAPAAPPAGAKRDRNAEIDEILSFVEANRTTLGLTVNNEWLRTCTPDQYRVKVLEDLGKREARPQPAAELALEGMTDKEVAGYSMARAMAIAAGLNRDGNASELGLNAKPSGLEWEVHKALERRMPASFERHGGILMPTKFPGSRGQRALVGSEAGKGAELVYDRPGDLIEHYRNRAVLGRMGARVLTGLVGPITFPKQTGAMTFYWMPENPGTGVTESDIALGSIVMQPKQLMGRTRFSRSLIVQAPSSGVDAEQLVRDDFAQGHTLTFDYAGLHGSGTNGEPLGLFNANGVLTQSLSTVDWAAIVAFTSKVAAVNAPLESCGWVTTPEAAGKFLSTPKISGAAASFLWSDAGNVYDSTMAGFRAMSSNQVKKTLGTGAQHGVAFGSWREVIVGSWGAVELTVDPFTLAEYGFIRVVSWELGDVIVRHTNAFCTGVVTP